MPFDVFKSVRDGILERLDEARLRLARPEALIPLALLGLVTGLLAGAVIIVFRLLVEGVQDAGLPGEGPENYEALPLWARIVLPLLAAVLLAGMFRWFGDGIQVLGVARVMERMANYQGRCTLRAFFLQFFGAAIAISGGHSVGREGPHIFLGAASGSLLGQAFALPNNVIRTLVGCGTAAGIAASFNTPLAGVVFALEVVMMEYTVASFIPVILAAVSATALSNQVFGDQPAFAVPALHNAALDELLLVLVIGVAAGAVSAAFVHAVQTVGGWAKGISIERRMMLAGASVGIVAIVLPQVMGIGYDTVGLALNGSLAAGLLVVLLLGKLAATSACIGLGVPGGMIGPSLFIGAVLGALIAEVGAELLPDAHNPVGFYALVGMGAMMSGSLQAPLAALTAMLELTDQPEVIMPGMLAVVVAGITAKEVFGKDSLFLAMLRANGIDYGAAPVHQALQRIGVASVMERSFVRLGSRLSRNSLDELFAHNPVYLVIDSDDGQLLMPAAALARYLESPATATDADADQDGGDIDLLAIPGERLHLEPIAVHANLDEAWRRFDDSAAEALVVTRQLAPGVIRVYGIVTPDVVERSYRS
ncbi:MAG: chloride channel protein [Gammaproteobacteria bacterium]|nr:chloride channel protein [Gammaproteobacteria bacterium]